jgi:hypothetical protein
MFPRAPHRILFRYSWTVTIGQPKENVWAAIMRQVTSWDVSLLLRGWRQRFPLTLPREREVTPRKLAEIVILLTLFGRRLVRISSVTQDSLEFLLFSSLFSEKFRHSCLLQAVISTIVVVLIFSSVIWHHWAYKFSASHPSVVRILSLTETTLLESSGSPAEEHLH